jgi:hypothetical protein
MAALGLEDFQQGTTPARRLAGIRNAVVWGRTFTLSGSERRASAQSERLPCS